MTTEHPRIKREKKPIEAMVKIYCKAKHETYGELCQECTDLLAYARMRLDVPLPREKKHLWEMPRSLLQARYERKSEGYHAVLGTTNAPAPSRSSATSCVRWTQKTPKTKQETAQ